MESRHHYLNMHAKKQTLPTLSTLIGEEKEHTLSTTSNIRQREVQLTVILPKRILAGLLSIFLTFSFDFCTCLRVKTDMITVIVFQTPVSEIGKQK